MAITDADSGTIVLPKRISLAIAAGFVLQLVVLVYHFGTTQAANAGDIERLKRDVGVGGTTMALINERTIRMEEQLAAIRASIERQARH